MGDKPFDFILVLEFPSCTSFLTWDCFFFCQEMYNFSYCICGCKRFFQIFMNEIFLPHAHKLHRIKLIKNAWMNKLGTSSKRNEQSPKARISHEKWFEIFHSWFSAFSFPSIDLFEWNAQFVWGRLKIDSI